MDITRQGWHRALINQPPKRGRLATTHADMHESYILGGALRVRAWNTLEMR
jgi:hypothetical protein